MTNPVFITRLTLRNYKSIAACRLNLGALTFLVGPNGSGKSNCLDGLRLVAESLRTSLNFALNSRGGIIGIQRRVDGELEPVAIRLDFKLPGGSHGHFAIELGAVAFTQPTILAEECAITAENGENPLHYYRVENGKVIESSMSVAPVASSDRFYLGVASGLPEFRSIYDELARIEVYSFVPSEIARVGPVEADPILRRDGGNAASIMARFGPQSRLRLNSYLSRIVPRVREVGSLDVGGQQVLYFGQDTIHRDKSTLFFPTNMSEGTLRAFAILLSLLQSDKPDGSPLALIGLEEPETGLHPAASAILLGALREASASTQVIVTSHSPDLLDSTEIPTEAIIAVTNEDGITKIAGIDEAGRSVLKEKLFTPGELLRQNQLAPDSNEIAKLADGEDVQIFGPSAK